MLPKPYGGAKGAGKKGDNTISQMRTGMDRRVDSPIDEQDDMHLSILMSDSNSNERNRVPNRPPPVSGMQPNISATRTQAPAYPINTSRKKGPKNGLKAGKARPTPKNNYLSNRHDKLTTASELRPEDSMSQVSIQSNVVPPPPVVNHPTVQAAASSRRPAAGPIPAPVPLQRPAASPSKPVGPQPQATQPTTTAQPIGPQAAAAQTTPAARPRGSQVPAAQAPFAARHAGPHAAATQPASVFQRDVVPWERLSSGYWDVSWKDRDIHGNERETKVRYEAPVINGPLKHAEQQTAGTSPHYGKRSSPHHRMQGVPLDSSRDINLYGRYYFRPSTVPKSRNGAWVRRKKK